MMTTNRGDMPAMPLTGDAYIDLQGYKGQGGTYEDGMGMTIREQFAISMAQGLVTAQDECGLWQHDAKTIAQTAVEYADALLTELERTK